VSSIVDPEEAEALAAVTDTAGDPSPQRSVERRNFSEPRRLSEERLKQLAKSVALALPAAMSAVDSLVRGSHKLVLADVAEVDARSLHAKWSDPILCAELECSGQRGWITWNGPAATRCAEMVLSGALDEEATERALSRSELRVVARLLGELLTPLVTRLEVSAALGPIVQTVEELDDVDDPDTQRLRIHLNFDGPGGSSDIILYLPGVKGLERLPDESDAGLPEHLEDVEVELRAFVGSTDVPLDELLKLEVGDVISLGTSASEPLDLYVEDRACALVQLGKHRGNLAVRIEQIDLHANQIDQPS